MGKSLEKILLIEDENSILITMKFQLEEEGYLVETAKTYKDAVKAVKGEGNYSGLNEYKYIITDNQLPDGLGINLVKMIRGSEDKQYNNQDVKIIVMSGTMKEDNIKQKLQHYNVNLFLEKPTPLHELNILL